MTESQTSTYRHVPDMANFGGILRVAVWSLAIYRGRYTQVGRISIWRYIDADGMSWLEVYGGWRYIEVVSEVKIKTARISGQAKSWRYIERRYSEV